MQVKKHTAKLVRINKKAPSADHFGRGSDSIWLRSPQFLGSFATTSYMQQGGGDAEVDDQGDRVDDGRDERRRHHGGVEAELLRDHRQGTANELRDKDGDHHSQADHQRDGNGDALVVEHQTVEQHDLREVRDRQRDTAQERDAGFLEYDLKDILELDLT